MNLKNPVSDIMTRELVTLTPEDDLFMVKELFENHSIHHIPVVHFRNLVGLVSKSDFYYMPIQSWKGSRLKFIAIKN